MNDMVLALDRMGREIKVGDTVVRSRSVNKGGSTTLDVQKVTKVNGSKVHLDGSNTPIKVLATLAVVSPL